jgi:hypothetical protein
MWSGYAFYGGTEIWNNQRTIDYLLGNPTAMQPGIALQQTVVTPWSGCSNARSMFRVPSCRSG